MADAKISALTTLAGSSIATDDYIPIVDTSGVVTKKIATSTAGVSAIPAFASTFLAKLAAGASVENIGAVESKINVVAATGSTETLDVSLYGWHKCTMDQNCTFTFSNPAPSGEGSVFLLELIGAFTPTFPTLKWPDGAAATYTTPSVYVFWTNDAGTTWRAKQVGKNFS
jgi:hypothetical protein